MDLPLEVLPVNVGRELDEGVDDISVSVERGQVKSGGSVLVSVLKIERRRPFVLNYQGRPLVRILCEFLIGQESL